MNDFSCTYILEDKVPVLESDTDKWDTWMQDINNLSVAVGVINENLMVSTIFLGTPFNPGEPKPLLFETAIRRHGQFDIAETWKYATWEEAEAGHKQVVEALRNGTGLPKC